jgi:hypothetical protein
MAEGINPKDALGESELSDHPAFSIQAAAAIADHVIAGVHFSPLEITGAAT